MSNEFTVDQFRISVPEQDLDDLRQRLERTRWPNHAPEPPWVAGSDITAMKRLVDYWREDFDWRRHEARLNELPQRVATIAGQRIHFLHFVGGERLPLVLTHGWPSTFVELVPLARLLHERGHAVVVPSLPGYTFSSPPTAAPAPVPTFELWHRLMTGLSYPRYGAHGGDLGAGVTSRLAAAHPEAVAAIHLLAVAQAQNHADLTSDEQAYLDHIAAWSRREGAYQHQQSTRPLTLAYGLTDSPSGLLAWIVEKYRAWSDCSGDLGRRWSDDDVLVQASLYWFTNTLASSLRPYFDYDAHPLGPVGPVRVPTAIAVFPHDLAQPPREYAARTYNVTRYIRFDHGGHFAAHEEPELLADDVVAFLSGLS